MKKTVFQLSYVKSSLVAQKKDLDFSSFSLKGLVVRSKIWTIP